MEKPDVQWIQDGSGTTTCHVNDGALNFEQSKIGTLVYRNENWHVVLKDGTDISPDGCSSLSRARTLMETHWRKQAGKSSPVAVDRKTPRVAQTGRA